MVVLGADRVGFKAKRDSTILSVPLDHLSIFCKALKAPLLNHVPNALRLPDIPIEPQTAMVTSSLRNNNSWLIWRVLLGIDTDMVVSLLGVPPDNIM